MAQFARVPAAIWREESFRSLTAHSQWAYLMLLSQPDLNAAGILPLRERRWATYAFALTVAQVQASLAELDVAGWAYSDDTQQEVFVSGFFAFEDIAKQPRRIVAAHDALATAELGYLVAGFEPSSRRGVHAVVLERDGYQCQHCGWKPGDPVPLKAGTRRPVYRGLEIDHIWPRSKGGADKEANYQVLCTSCNSRKGART